MSQPVDGADLSTLVLAAGALGAAAAGIVEMLKKKWAFLGEAGYPKLEATLAPMTAPLKVAYGADVHELLKAQYVSDDPELIRRTLNHGMRAGLTSENAQTIADLIKTVDGKILASVPDTLAHGQALDDPQRNVLGRYELAVDARIQAALASALDSYAGTIRAAAMIVSLILAIACAVAITIETGDPELTLFIKAFIVGIVAVPLAPVYKDVASALNELTKTLRRKK